jgi:hypothetical protein
MLEPPQSNRRLDARHHSIAAPLAVIALCAALTAEACSGDATSPRTGTLTGNVVLQDSWATTLGDFSGVTVNVDGLSLSAVTDTAGSWRIDGVPVGKHDVVFKKATFGTGRIAQQPVDESSTTAPPMFLAVTPWEQAIIDSVHVVTRTGRDYYVIDGHLSAPPPATAKAVVVVGFLGRTVAVSNDPASYGAWNQYVDPTGKLSTFSISLQADAVRSTFGVGSHAFAAAYVTVPTCSCYPNGPETTTVFSNTGPRANVVELTVK